MKDNELYKTKRVIYIKSSKHNSVKSQKYYPIYMDYTSTDGILDINEKLIPLAKLRENGIEWERVK